MDDSDTPMKKKLRVDTTSTTARSDDSMTRTGRHCFPTLTTRGSSPATELEQVSNVASLLSVPLSIILCQVRNRPLLSRAEAQAFLTVRMLAEDLDAVVSVSSAACHQEQTLHCLAQSIQSFNHPYLRPLLPLLRTDHDFTLVQQDLDRIVGELQEAGRILLQFAEQNWTVAVSLVDAAGLIQLAQYKQLLSDVQAELCRRIDSILRWGNNEIDDVMDYPVSTMQEYCEKLWTDVDSDDQQGSVELADISKKPAETDHVRIETCATREFSGTSPSMDCTAGNESVPLPMVQPRDPSAVQQSNENAPYEQLLALKHNVPPKMTTQETTPIPSSAEMDDEPGEPSPHKCEKENIKSHDHMYDIMYGSQTSVSSDHSCGIGSPALKAAELLNVMSRGRNGTVTTSSHV